MVKHIYRTVMGLKESIIYQICIGKKHFDNNFPEHKNIKYTNDNKCHVLELENNLWKEKDLGLLSRNLIKDNTEVLLLYCDHIRNKSDDKEAYSNS